ncbi:MAG TPA: hypothetical protein VFH66_00850 [Mycobacteriales bacterium]|nr:hypothetical protein [Mycobacteriales bacterium]
MTTTSPPRPSTPPTVTPGWYPDPGGRHQFRYADEHGWTDTVADNGMTMRDPLPPPPGPSRRRWWIVAAVVGAIVVGAAALVGVARIFDSMDTYRADLTKGHGDFLTRDTPDVAEFYAQDGYHVVGKTPGWVESGVTASTGHTVLGVQLTARAVTIPGRAAFGPMVGASNHNLFSFLVDNRGKATLVEEKADGTVRQIATSSSPPLVVGGEQRVLFLHVAVSMQHGTATLTGYVDGVQVITGTTTLPVKEVIATGMAGYVYKQGPAEWVVPKFARLGPDTKP